MTLTPIPEPKLGEALLPTKMQQQLRRIRKVLIEPLCLAGYSCWLVGGYVRDVLRGAVPNDVDVATDASVQQLLAWLSSVRLRHVTQGAGITHGTLKILVPGVREPIDIACLRQDVTRLGRRHAHVVFTQDLALDLARRDFTINAMAASCPPEKQLWDPFGGREDIDAQHVRFVGDAAARIREDPLRLLRMARMATLGCKWRAVIETNLAGMSEAFRAELATISAERVRTEIVRAMGNLAPQNFWRTLLLLGLAPMFIDPVAQALSGGAKSLSTTQMADVISAGCRALERLGPTPKDPMLPLAAMGLSAAGAAAQMLHADPTAVASGDWTTPWSRVLKLTEAQARDLNHLTQHAFIPSQDAQHMGYLSRLSVGPRGVLKSLDAVAALQDACAFKRPHDIARLRQLLVEGRPLTVADLAISGHDLIAWGVAPGPGLAQHLNACLRHAQNVPGDNTVSRLRAFLKL